MKEEQPHFDHPQQQSPMPTAPDVNAQLVSAVESISTQVQSLQNKRAYLKTDVWGLFQTVSVVPTQTPSTPYEQVQIYVNATTYRLYWYDSVGQAWHYVTATA